MTARTYEGAITIMDEGENDLFAAIIYRKKCYLRRPRKVYRIMEINIKVQNEEISMIWRSV